MGKIASLIILTPVLLPLIQQIGVDPLHFGVILVLNLVIGLTTPPGRRLSIHRLFDRPNESDKTVPRDLPFLLASIIVLLICTYWEALVLAIPVLFGYKPV